VLWSHQIEKSVRIRDFLAYVCERSFQDPSAEIHEQEIGCQVFGRSGNYDTAVDNVVRVTASQARRKLEQYFSAEGAAEPFTLEIPKGQYAPIFCERNAAADAEAPAPGSPAPISRVTWLLAASVLVLTGVAAWACLTLWTERRTAAPLSELEANSSLSALWSQLLPHGGRTDVVVMDSSLSLFQELQQRQLTLPEYLQPDVWTRGDSLSSNPKLRAFVHRMAQRRLTSLGSVTTALRIAQFAAASQTRISVFSARDFNIRQMKADNIVLLGSSIANPWVSLVEDRLSFRFGFDRVSQFAYFENRNPQPGEPKMYRTDSDISYCLVAFLPNLARTGNILAICGAEVEGTEGGGEFVTSERTVDQLRSLAKVGSGDRLPYFEVLLKSSKVGGSTPGFLPVVFRLLSL
jgi:hypothetical protein